MIDYKRLHNDPQDLIKIVEDMNIEDLRNELNSMIDTFEGMISDCVDADAVF